jgi:hypothetical protein
MKTPSFPFPARPTAPLFRALAAGALLFPAAASLSLAQETPPPPPAAGADAGASGDPEAYTEYPASRYDKIRVKSPFEFELAKPKEDEKVDPFQDLVLAGYAGSANRVTVYLANTKTQERMTIPGSSDHNDTGFKVISVNRGTMLKNTTVTLEKSGITKNLSFDSKALSNMVASGGAGGAAPGVPGRPGQPVLPGGARPPGAAPGVVGARPAAAAPYVAPQAYVPGRNGNNNNAAGNNGALQVGLPNGNPAPAGNVNLAGSMVGNTNGQIAPGQVQTGQPAPATVNQPRRRVVLPTGQ